MRLISCVKAKDRNNTTYSSSTFVFKTNLRFVRFTSEPTAVEIDIIPWSIPLFSESINFKQVRLLS